MHAWVQAEIGHETIRAGEPLDPAMTGSPPTSCRRLPRRHRQLLVIMAAIFWTTLWGPVGLFLSTPLTVCLVVMGRYVPKLEFLGILLGSDPVLADEERFYQRLLAGNVEEAVEIAEAYVDEASALRFYDEVALPALRLAETDRRRSTSDINYRRIVAQGATAVVREVADHLREKRDSGVALARHEPGGSEEAPTTPESREPRPQQATRPFSVLCIGGRSELDLAAAEMMAHPCR